MRCFRSALPLALLSLVASCAESSVGAESDGRSGGSADARALPPVIIGSDAGSGPTPGESDLDARVQEEPAAGPDADVDPNEGPSVDAGSVEPDEASVSEAATDAEAPLDAAPDAMPRASATAKDAAAPMEASSPMTPTCGASQRLCGDRCADTRSEAANCGGCGMVCGAGESCIESRCYPPLHNGCTARSYGSRAYLFCTDPRPFQEARTSCLAQRMDLVVIDDEAENAFVHGIGGIAWFGATDILSEGRFRQVLRGMADRFDGLDLMFTKWATGEPNNRRCTGQLQGGNCVGGEWVEEDCAQMYLDGTWNDGRCIEPQRYVCESY